MGTTSAIVHSLPHQTTSFIGRQQEIAGIISLLGTPDCHLLTLWGPGGIGKTRLAIEIARQTGASFPDGILYLALQPLNSMDQVIPALINALGLMVSHAEMALQQLLSYLGDKRLLLLLDNFEHLPDGAGLISDILAAAPFVKILVTSRETFRLREEWRWEVRGLSYPSPDATLSPETYSAIQLFVERARQIRPNFMPAEGGTALTRICQLVEGMPLALELAAHWTKMLCCEAIVDEVQRNIDFLTSQASNIPPRHRSIRAVFEHSWRLLSDDERGAFPRLTVFRGGFTREAAAQVSDTPFAILAALVDKCLVRWDGTSRYDIHELLRQFGEERLTATDTVETLNDCHATYFASFLAQCVPDLKGNQQIQALNAIEADFDNVRTAWDHAAAQRDYNLVDQMFEGLFLYCQFRSRMVEAQALSEHAMTALLPTPGENPHPVWGRVMSYAGMDDLGSIEEALTIALSHGRDADAAFCLLRRGWHHCQQRRFAFAYRDFRDSLVAYQRLGDRYGMAQALANLSHVSMSVGDRAAARTYDAQGAHIAEEIGNARWEYAFLFHGGWGACCDGLYGQAEQLLRQAEALASAAGFRHLMADTRGSLGFLAFLRGDLAQARTYLADDLEITTHVGAQGEQGFATLIMAHIACVEENYQQARLLAEKALALVKPHVVRERIAARVLAMAACGLSEYDQARQQLQTVLVQEFYPGDRLLLLPMAALLQAHERNFQRAAEWLGLSFAHPASAAGWLERWPLITRLRQQLETQLGDKAFAAAWENGSHLDLDTVIAQAIIDTDVQAKPALIEALTGRELETLRLVAEGLSNRDVADSLVIAESTVRTHIYNFCQKLGACNRTQAVARARTLHIL